MARLVSSISTGQDVTALTTWWQNISFQIWWVLQSLVNVVLFLVTAVYGWYLLCMQVIPPYNGFGIPEDSLQNCLSLFPKPPRKDIIKMLENNLKVLRYQVALVSVFLGGTVPGGWEEQPALTRLLANSPLCQREKRAPWANTSVLRGMQWGYCVLAVTTGSSLN